MIFKISGEIHIQEKELREYANKYLGNDYKEYYTWNEVMKSYMENYMTSCNGKRFFTNIDATKEFKIWIQN